MSSTRLASHYWTEFVRLKVHVAYLELRLARTERTERGLSIFLAVTSSASIGAWAVWRELGFFWGLLIATSQVVGVVRRYLPYRERLRCVAGLMHDLEELVLLVEARWLDITAGELTEAQIHKALADLRTKRQRAFKKHFPDRVLPESLPDLQRAEEATQAYMQNFYSEQLTHGNEPASCSPAA